ncbi:holo-[acyl-carrier-protein] synthase [Chlamydia ibidis]|uniref:Holo-[acyl-carrier-protein] synthase n=3 Tax=Chlamydia ibidis TaxID=1405396 RepID=S7KHI5_9CHLA|nr:holo-[acyl-carrier-protein] synthase [Chlamydia ibidis]EQM62591.1 holo-[acyl-carrier-protein] synthase [Chlamydia ibidis 10-1398/6]
MLNRLFTTQEQDYCFQSTNPYPSLAARYAAKEAVSKALGTGIGKKIGWKDIEIIRTNGQPEVLLNKKIREELQVKKVLLSFSHSREYATAVAIVLAQETFSV